MKLGEAKKEFVENLGKLNRSPATVVAYEKDIEQLSDVTGDADVTQITTKQLQDFINVMLANPNYTAKTVSRKLNSIKSLFKFLKKQGTVLVDPSKPIPHPEIKSKLPRFLTETEYRGLRDAAKNNIRLYTIIEFMLQTGLRIGEISRLKVEHLKLGQNPGQVLIVEHGSSPMRLVELNETATNVIKEFLPNRLEVENDEGYVFNTKSGKNMLIRNIRSAINRIFRKAKIKHATVNDLRNTFIVHQLEAGVSLAKVAQLVGHKRYSSTEKYLPLLERGKPGRRSKLAEL